MHMCFVKDNNRIIANGYGLTEKEAKRDCCKNALLNSGY